MGKALLAASVRHWGVNRLQAVHGVGHLDGDPTGLIAHRLVTVSKCDRIIVVDHGHIAEQGTHEELIALGGIYKNLYEMQEVGS